MQERIQSVNGQIERLESQAQFIFQRDDLLLRRIAEIDKVFKNSPRDFKTVLQFLKDNTTINKDIEDLNAQSSLIEIKAKEIVDSEIDKISIMGNFNKTIDHLNDTVRVANFLPQKVPQARVLSPIDRRVSPMMEFRKPETARATQGNFAKKDMTYPIVVDQSYLARKTSPFIHSKRGIATEQNLKSYQPELPEEILILDETDGNIQNADTPKMNDSMFSQAKLSSNI